MALKQTAVEQDPQTGALDQMLAAGDFSRRPAERDFH
jgi:hypothetical protein